MKVAFYTLGCKVNQYETEVLTERFLEKGCEVVPFEDIADIYVINTCTVTAVSDKKSRQALRQARARNNDAVVVAAGCYPQAAAEEVKKMPEIDIAVGTENKYQLVGLAISKAKRFEINDNKAYSPYDFDRVTGHHDRTRATLKIEDGCNNFCAYCKIPYARGRVRSKSIKNATEEFKTILDNGYLEIVVTGIEVASFGQDSGEALIDLFCEFEKLCGDRPVRIRLGSLEPRLITEEFAQKLSTLSHFCPQFHLSLQSGCDETLKRMNRKYDTALYAKSVEYLRKYIKNTTITTDLIVGFPNESEEEFNKTLKFLEQIRFLKVHIFPYSKREGTPAAKMEGQLDRKVKATRAKIAGDLCDKIRSEILHAQIGCFEEVLFETEKNGVWQGYTKNYMPVKLKSSKKLHNILMNIEIIGCDKDTLIGKKEM